MKSVLGLIESFVSPDIKHKIIKATFETVEEWDVFGFKHLLLPPQSGLQAYERPLKKVLMFTEDIDGAVYIGKGSPAAVEKAIRTYLESGEIDEDEDEDEEEDEEEDKEEDETPFDVEFGGKGQYFNYALEKESCDFYPTLSEAVNYSFEGTHMSRPIEIALEKLFLGKPLYVTDVGDLLFKLLSQPA